MELIETIVTKASVRMRYYADRADPAQELRWLDFQVPVTGMKLPLVRGEEDLGDDPNIRTLAEVQLAALYRVRAVIAAEIHRFGLLRDPNLQ